MDLRIHGRHAIVCASSRGLGRACAEALAREGVNVVINGRDAQAVEATAADIGVATGVIVTPVVGDLNTDEGRQRLLAACPAPDILVNNNAGPPPGPFVASTDQQWRDGLNANLIAPMSLIKAVVTGMQERRFGRIVNITSAMVKEPHPMMTISTAARTGLTALCKGVSGDVAKDNVTINNLLPERFDTDRQKRMVEAAMAYKGWSREEAEAYMVDQVAAKRLGQPAEFGDACAFLCSAQAGYISGQNLQLDGGSYPGLI